MASSQLFEFLVAGLQVQALNANALCLVDHPPVIGGKNAISFAPDKDRSKSQST